MKNETGKLTIIGLGGAGIKSGISAFEMIKSNEVVCSDVDIKLIDATTKTILGHSDYKDNFFRMVSKRAGGSLDGTGAEKQDKAVIKDFTENIKEFLDISKFKNGKNDYYVILTSGSGGTGSTSSAILCSIMLSKGYNVMVVVIGDTSSYQSLKNTNTTFMSLQKIALKTKSALGVIYYNNTVNDNTTLSSELDVNTKISKMLTVISVFISGNVLNIDNQDMINFFKPTNYTSFTIQPGIYDISVFRGVLDDLNALIARTLLKDSKDEYLVKVKLRSKKHGIVNNDISQLIEAYPLHLVLRKNVLTKIVNELSDELKAIDDLNKSEYEAFNGIDDVSVVDEDEEDLGLVF